MSIYWSSINQADNKDKEAIAEYEKILSFAPDQLLVMNNLAWLYQMMGQHQKALNLADKLADKVENNPEIQDTVGWIYFQNGNIKKGLALLKQAAILAPHLPSIRFHLAQALIANHQPAKAKKILERLLKEDKKFAEREQAETLLKSL